MAKFTFKGLLEDIKKNGVYDNAEAFKSLVVEKFKPWISDGKPELWHDGTERGEQRVIVKASAPLDKEDISTFGWRLCEFFGLGFTHVRVHTRKPYDVDLVIAPNGPNGLKLTFTFFTEIAEIYD